MDRNETVRISRLAAFGGLTESDANGARKEVITNLLIVRKYENIDSKTVCRCKKNCTEC